MYVIFALITQRFFKVALCLCKPNIHRVMLEDNEKRHKAQTELCGMLEVDIGDELDSIGVTTRL